jgi:hypothetical protein
MPRANVAGMTLHDWRSSDVGVVGCQLDRPAQPLLHVGAASRQPIRVSFSAVAAATARITPGGASSCRACPAAPSASAMTSVMT